MEEFFIIYLIGFLVSFLFWSFIFLLKSEKIIHLQTFYSIIKVSFLSWLSIVIIIIGILFSIKEYIYNEILLRKLRKKYNTK